MNRLFRITDVVYLFPLVILLFIGGPWSQARSPLPMRSAWNIIAPEGTSVSVLDMSRSGCRVEIKRVNTRVNDLIRIERKIDQSDLDRGRIDYELKADPSRQMSANIYQHHAPWRMLQSMTPTFVKEGECFVSCPIDQQLLDNDGAVVFIFEPKLGSIQIQSATIAR